MTISVNNELQQLNQTCSVADFLIERGLTGKRLAVELNRQIVPRSQHSDQMLSDGDKMEIIHAIGGG
ncbi:MAG: sulfur carrier protein ThiS [Immundisolibacteraceae bacterium]|nr:sulfur carrier protein ThiS [Immundisolibacteraceae bacterium]